MRRFGTLACEAGRADAGARRSWRFVGFVSAIAVAMAVVGCEGPTPPRRGIEPLGSAPAAAPPSAEARPSTRVRETPTQRPPIEIVPPAPIVVRETVEERRARTRDLPAELGIAFGDPTACFDALPPQVRDVYIDLSCIVHEDGVTSSCRASATYETPAIEACLRSRFSALRIEGGVAAAPRPVGSRLELHR